MSLVLDRYRITLGMPLTFATGFFQPISSRLVAEGIFASTIRSGWGASQPAGGSEILLEIEFTTKRDDKNDAQIQTLSRDIAVITGTPVREISRSLTTILVPVTPLPTVNSPNTIQGTDLSGIITVNSVGVTPIVLTFGTPYILVPVVVASWSANTVQVGVVATINGITFDPSNGTINGKKISYACL